MPHFFKTAKWAQYAAKVASSFACFQERAKLHGRGIEKTSGLKGKFSSLVANQFMQPTQSDMQQIK